MNISDIHTILKRQFALYCIALALPIAFAFLILDVIEDDMIEVLADGLLLLALLSGYICTRKFKASMVVYRVTLTLIGIIFLYNVTIGAGNGTILYWIFPIPLIFLFFLGKREGGLYTGIFFFVMCILMFDPFSFGVYPYDTGTTARFLFSQVLVILMAYGLETARERYGELLVAKHRKLMEGKRHLEEARGKIRTLSGLIPICSSCKKIRDDKGFWQQVDVYVTKHSSAEFSHGICPDCADKYYLELEHLKSEKAQG
jgi:hypothetical protein